MIRKIYKLIPSAKQGLIALALTVFSGAVSSQNTYTFNYTGASQTLALNAGSYSIQCWGANGGNPIGGKGGYSTGSITVTSPTTAYIYVGGVGTVVTTNGSGNALGGWNGGGNGSCYAGYGSSAGGGGGSDVRMTQNTTYANRIIVAGGGGGGGYYNSTGHSGGNGGGSTGGNGVGYNNNSYWPGQGGTQTAGGLGTTESTSIVGAGGFGVGGNHSTTSSNGYNGCGGGGGWYGGSAGGAVHSGGGGGSGYIGGVTSGTTFIFGSTGYVANPVTTGNGLVIIKELCNISLLVNGVSGNTTICAGNSLSLTTNGVSNYTWSTGATTSSIVVAPTTTTVYTLSAMSASNCISSSQVTITVNSGLPTLTVVNTASSTSGICPSNSVMLTASGANTYSWTGATSVTNGVTFYPTSSSGYTVTGENACGTSSVAVSSISIHPLPTTGTVISQPTVCSGQTVALTGVGNATLYTWAPFVPNGGAFFPPVTSSYTVTGYSAQGCTSSAVAFVTVVATPIAQPLASPPLICIGKSSTITALGATNYTIISPTGTVNTSTLVVTPNATTTYTVTKSNSNCFNTQQVTVIVNLLPPVNGIATPSIVCASKSVALQAIGGTSFTWTAANYTSTTANPTVYPANSTVYSLTASDGTCTASTTVSVLTNPNPTITVAPTSSAICFGDSVTIVAGGALTYTWSTPTGTVVSDTVAQAPLTTTLYIVTGVNQHNCYSSNSQAIIVHPNPTLNIQTTKPLVCPGGVSSLTVSGANTYSWDANAGNASTNIVSVNPTITTTYTVTGYYVPTMCNTEKTFTVNVFQPTFAINSPTSSCKGGTINLIASGAISYTWNGTQPFSQIAVSPPTETVYVVSATSGSNGVNCVSTQTAYVSIYENPTITAVAQRTVICNGEFVNLVGGGGAIYNWNSGQITMTGSVVPVNPKANQTYFVTGIDQNGCIGTASVQVKVSPCIGIGEMNNADTQLSVFPNPNGGQFTVKSTSPVTLTLSNELGQLIEVIELNSANVHQIEIRNLAPGIYFIKGEGLSEKIVVTR